MATWSSSKSLVEMPPEAHLSFSVWLMGREASETSISVRQKQHQPLIVTPLPCVFDPAVVEARQRFHTTSVRSRRHGLRRPLSPMVFAAKIGRRLWRVLGRVTASWIEGCEATNRFQDRGTGRNATKHYRREQLH